MKVPILKFVQTASIAAVIATAGSLGQVYAQDAPPPVGDSTPPAGDVAPPVGADGQAAPGDTQSPDSNVFNWKDVPTNQQIVIDRAVFDQGGYQLYCHTGETIVIPFANQNLYVMKFGRSDVGTYFVNDGTTPTLYVPEGGYLENSAANGAKWYPFPADYNYTVPVYEGVAPTWDAYVNMAWYPGMECYGGYWGYRPYAVGVVFAPLPGFYISVFNQPYYGWNSYRSYYVGHPESRVFFRSAPAFHYNHFPARGPEYYAGGHAFGSGRIGGVADTHFGGARPNPAFGHPSTQGHFGNPSFGGSSSGRSASPQSAHVWGSSASSGHVPFGGQGSGYSSSSTEQPTHRAFGGATYSPSGPSRSSWGDGSTHNWGSSSSSHAQPASGHAWSSGGGSAGSGSGHSESGGSSHTAPSGGSGGESKSGNH